jgi:hypothetical protein
VRIYGHRWNISLSKNSWFSALLKSSPLAFRNNKATEVGPTFAGKVEPTLVDIFIQGH